MEKQYVLAGESVEEMGKELKFLKTEAYELFLELSDMEHEKVQKLLSSMHFRIDAIESFLEEDNYHPTIVKKYHDGKKFKGD